MKKILHVIAGMNAGGMETMIMNYYRNIDRNKYKFDFLINEPNECFYEKEILKLGGKIYRVPFQRENYIKNHKMVKDIIKNNHYDAIHEHQGITYYYPLKCAKKYGIKNRIVHNHGINRNFLKYLKLYNNFYAKKRICSLGNNFVCCSDEVSSHIFDKASVEKRGGYTILPNSINVRKYTFNKRKRKEVRDKFSLGNNKVFIHIGTFTAPKNHIFLIEMFKEHLDRRPNDKLLLIGDGPLKEEINKKVINYDLYNNILFLGTRNNISDFLSAADVMLFPSLYEGIPLTLIEAQASGIPIIGSTNIDINSSVSDLIKFVDLNDKNKWLEFMLSSMNEDKKRINYNDIVYKSRFSIDESVKILENIYNKF